MSIGKTIFRTALIGGLAVGAATLIWPDHMFAGFDQVKGKVTSVVDNMIDDPVVMRRKLQKLAEQLPEKIDELHAEIGEVDRQIAELQRDSEVAEGVIAKTATHLQELDQRLAEAKSERHAGPGVVRVRFNGRRLDVQEAMHEFHRINTIRESYQDRLAINERDLTYLQEQRGRLVGLLDKLESEYATIQTQMWQIDRKIEAIERNERIVETLEEREDQFAAFDSKFDISSLNELQSQIEQWEREIEARYERLQDQRARTNYEDEVRRELELQEWREAEDVDYDTEESLDEEGDPLVFDSRFHN